MLRAIATTLCLPTQYTVCQRAFPTGLMEECGLRVVARHQSQHLRAVGALTHAADSHVSSPVLLTALICLRTSDGIPIPWSSRWSSRTPPRSMARLDKS